jgi:hypothetical protein
VSSDRSKRSLFQLITELPHLFGALVRAEIEQLRRELIARLKGTGIGLALFVVAINLVVAAVLLLVLAGVFALSLVTPLWLSALIVAGALLLLAVIVVAIAVAAIKKGGAPIPRRTLDSIREDVAIIRGEKKRGHP